MDRQNENRNKKYKLQQKEHMILAHIGCMVKMTVGTLSNNSAKTKRL